MKSLNIISVIALVGIVILGGIFWNLTKGQGGEGSKVLDLATLPLAQEVEKVLDRKALLVAVLVSNPLIIEEVKKANESHEGITPEEIEELDQKWRTSDGIDDFIRPFLMNDVAEKLLLFQEENLGFSEIFITDEIGLNVGQTNKTTDYYQADEEWWIEAYNSGEGMMSHGSIEFDESAQAEAISLYVPIYDPDTQRVIGVTKAVLSIAAIKIEL